MPGPRCSKWYETVSTATPFPLFFVLICFPRFQALEARQVEEAVSSIFHTLLFHRTLGKFTYKQEGNYTVGTVGYEDVDCDFIDLTYVLLALKNLTNMYRANLFGVISDAGSLQLGRNAADRPQGSQRFRPMPP